MDGVPDARSRHVVGAGARARGQWTGQGGPERARNEPWRAARRRLGRPSRALPTAGCFGFRIAQKSAYGGVFEPGSAAQVGLLPASGHFRAGCKSVSKTRRLVIRAGGLPALPHALAPASTCGTLWPVCRRKRPAASDAGLPSSCRRFRPRSSRRPVFSDAGERETAPPGASSEPLPDKHAGRSRNKAAAGALFYSV